MKEKLTQLCYRIKEAMRPHGLNITGLHYFVPESFQRKRSGILVCFDADTSNPYFFGVNKYQNWRRIKLLDLAFKHGYEAVAGMCPDSHVTLDVYVNLKQPYVWAPPAFGNSPQAMNGPVDVTVDHDVKFVELAQMMESGEVKEGSTLHKYCTKYGIGQVLKHGFHCISPDSASVESLEAIADAAPLHSVLEIGAGVGICGVAAERRGIKNFTFFDISPTVCNYLRQRFPGFRVICADATSLVFNRDSRLVLVGVPYELVPQFLAEKGAGLWGWSDIVVIQSGCPAFFEFENDWIAGDKRLENWPWWESCQTLKHYFPHVAAMSLDWQSVVIGCRYEEEFHRIIKSMRRHGFIFTADIKYQRVSI